MKKVQVSTSAGWLTILGGFLVIYQDVKLVDFMSVFLDLTFGQVIAMIIPFASGVLGIVHNESD